jgi:hypothetical protein
MGGASQLGVLVEAFELAGGDREVTRDARVASANVLNVLGIAYRRADRRRRNERETASAPKTYLVLVACTRSELAARSAAHDMTSRREGGIADPACVDHIELHRTRDEATGRGC